MSNPFFMCDGKMGKAAANLEVRLDSYVSIYLARRHLLLFHFLPNPEGGPVILSVFSFLSSVNRSFSCATRNLFKEIF